MSSSLCSLRFLKAKTIPPPLSLRCRIARASAMGFDRGLGERTPRPSASIFPVAAPAFPRRPQAPITWSPMSRTVGVAYFLKQDDQCRAAPGLSDNSVPATSGSVVLESIDASPGKRARGSYDIILRSGEHITGTFDAAYC